MTGENKKFDVGRLDFPLGPEDRAKINQELQLWFSGINKKPSADLEDRIARYRPKLSKLSQQIVLYNTSNGTFSEAAGDSAKTLLELKAGTMWFDPCTKLELRLLAALST